jgi:hypothetical protein
MMGAEALGRGLFPQAQDPALQRAQVTQSIVQKYRGQDINSPSVLSQMASEFSQAGLPELAMELGDRVRQITPKAESIFAKIDPKDYTPESFQAFAESGYTDRTLLRAVPKDGAGFKVTSDFLQIIDPKDRNRVLDAVNKGQSVPTDLTFLTEKDSSGTEFERMLKFFPPEQQQRLREQYIKSKVASTMSPSLVPVALKAQGELSTVRVGATDIAQTISNLRSGKLKLGLKENFVNSLKTLAGKSDEGSRAYSQFNVALERLRNARLNLNVGVQTEGDAERAMAEFLSNYDRYDTETAVTQLERIYDLLGTAYGSKQNDLKTMYSSSGTPLPDSFFNAFPKLESGKPKKTYTEDELKSGFERAKEKYPEWKTRGYDAYKKQMTGQK